MRIRTKTSQRCEWPAVLPANTRLLYWRWAVEMVVYFGHFDVKAGTLSTWVGVRWWSMLWTAIESDTRGKMGSG